MTSKKDKALFDELEAWSRKKNSFSVNDFLKEKKIPLDEFERIANGSKRFMKIWGEAEDQAWENLQDALFTKSLPRSKIAEYIKEHDAFQGEDPEEVMCSLERIQARLEIYLTAIGDTESLRKYGRIGCKTNQMDAFMLIVSLMLPEWL